MGNKQHRSIDKKYIRRCIQLANNAVKADDNPFGSVIVQRNKIISESGNKIVNSDITNHAEIIVMREAQKIKNSNDLSDCEIYSNCEPCPMCAFMMRELKFSRVVFSLTSPYMGGYSKWNILEDKELERFTPFFSKPPEVVAGLLEREAKESFELKGWNRMI